MDKATVDVGHFASQGIHPTSGLPYPELMALHHFGDPSQNIPARPFLRPAFREEGLTDRGFLRNSPFGKRLAEIMKKAMGG